MASRGRHGGVFPMGRGSGEGAPPKSAEAAGAVFDGPAEPSSWRWLVSARRSVRRYRNLEGFANANIAI